MNNATTQQNQQMSAMDFVMSVLGASNTDLMNSLKRIDEAIEAVNSMGHLDVFTKAAVLDNLDWKRKTVETVMQKRGLMMFSKEDIEEYMKNLTTKKDGELIPESGLE